MIGGEQGRDDCALEVLFRRVIVQRFHDDHPAVEADDSPAHIVLGVFHILLLFRDLHFLLTPCLSYPACQRGHNRVEISLNRPQISDHGLGVALIGIDAFFEDLFGVLARGNVEDGPAGSAAEHSFCVREYTVRGFTSREKEQ